MYVVFFYVSTARRDLLSRECLARPAWAGRAHVIIALVTMKLIPPFRKISARSVQTPPTNSRHTYIIHFTVPENGNVGSSECLTIRRGRSQHDLATHRSQRRFSNNGMHLLTTASYTVQLWRKHWYSSSSCEPCDSFANYSIPCSFLTRWTFITLRT